jgi:hypothetical protein
MGLAKIDADSVIGHLDGFGASVGLLLEHLRSKFPAHIV